MQNNFKTNKGIATLIKKIAKETEDTETNVIELAIISYAIRKVGIIEVVEIIKSAYRKSEG